MRIVPSKGKSNPKQSVARKGIMDLLRNARSNPHRNIKKPQRIKPRYGIYDNAGWARVKRKPVAPPIDDIANSRVTAKPLKERVKARIDDNLDFLLENQSERNSNRFRPPESYVNLADNKRNDESQLLSQRTECDEAEANENVAAGSYIPQKVVLNQKQSDAKKDIMDLIKNARTNRHRNIKKQPRIKPRHGIFGSSMWARVKRHSPIDDIARSQAAAEPLNERVNARTDDNLDFLLRSQSEMNSKRNNALEYLSQQRKCNEAEANEIVVVGSQANDSQYAIFDGNPFQISPSVIDITTPLAKDDPILTPYSEYSGIMDSMDFKVANVFDKEPMANFDTPTPSEANAFGEPFNDIDNTVQYITKYDFNRDYVSGNTFDAFQYNGIDFDELDAASQMTNPHETELTKNALNANTSGRSADQLSFGDYSPDSGKSMETNYNPSSRYREVSCAWTPSVVDYKPAPQQQPLSEQLSDRIRSKITENMLRVIRSISDSLFPPVHDDPFDRSCVEYGTEWLPGFRQTDAENRPVVSYQSTQASSTAYDGNGASATTFQQIFNNAFFRNNNVTIMQTCTATRIIRSSAANAFSTEFGFYEFDDDNFQL